jgi:hypothetical protein
MDVIQEVKDELNELAKYIRVPEGAYRVAETDAEEFEANGMSIAGIASLCIDLSDIG